MSLWRDLLGRVTPSFPRVSGDEPAAATKAWTSCEFSPRERG